MSVLDASRVSDCVQVSDPHLSSEGWCPIFWTALGCLQQQLLLIFSFVQSGQLLVNFRKRVVSLQPLNLSAGSARVQRLFQPAR